MKFKIKIDDDVIYKKVIERILFDRIDLIKALLKDIKENIDDMEESLEGIYEEYYYSYIKYGIDVGITSVIEDTFIFDLINEASTLLDILLVLVDNNYDSNAYNKETYALED